MNYSIIYSAEYRYDEDVSDQHNAVRVRPLDDERQRVEGFDLSIDPGARLYEHTDYFGTSVIEFAISEPHDHLTIDAESRVSVDEPPAPPEGEWAGLRERSYLDAGAEYLEVADPAAGGGRIAELSAEARGDTPLATLRSVCALIPDRFQYQPGATYVGSTVADLLEGGAGVCQDFVHLGLAMLRHQRIAGRYVSGYLFAPNGEGSEDSAEVHTHAWLEALLPGPGDEPATWVAGDPTNRTLIGDDHVKIGHGRSYSDVPPIRGVFRGSSRSDVEATVKMTRQQ